VDKAKSYTAKFNIWRGDSAGGALREYTVEVNEGEVVLDIIFRIQADQANDLAVRWNCKAGKCGSCSAEINGRPRLMCMTRMSSLPPGESVTVTPLRTFPVLKDLVTDVSFNYQKAKQIPSFAPKPRGADGKHRMAQIDVERARSSASASSAGCARTSVTSSATTRRTNRRSPARGSSSAWPNSTCTPSTPMTAR